MALRTLIGDGPEKFVSLVSHKLLLRQIFLAGSRELDPPETEYIAQAGISVTRPEEFADPKILIGRIKSAGFNNIYVHLDLDVLNPDSFPNSLMQTPGGPSVAEVQELIKILAKSFNVVGFSIVEYCEHERDNSVEILKDLVTNSAITNGWNGVG
jgi:arginase